MTINIYLLLLFIRTFYFWVPVWGPVLSLMYLGRSSFQKRDVLLDIDTLSPLNLDTSYGGSGRLTISQRKTLSDSIGTGGKSPGGGNHEDREERPTVYRPPDYPSALFSRDSAYQYDDDCMDGSGSNVSFDAPLSSMLPMNGNADQSTLVDYYDAFLLNSPNPAHHNHPSVDTAGTTISSGYPSHPSLTTDTESSSII